MEFLHRAKVFRLKCSHQSKYLIADQDEETVKLSRDNCLTNSHWSFERVEGPTNNVIRLRSCFTAKYLTASEDQFLLGMTGKRVSQRPWLGPTVEWEVIREGPYVKLKTHNSRTFLRANRGPPPWRNTITHDLAGHWTASENMILWIIDIVEIDSTMSIAAINDDGVKSLDEVKGINNNNNNSNNGVLCLPSNLVDQRVLSSSSSLSTEDDGSSNNVPSSLENCISFTNLKSMLANMDDAIEVEYIDDGEETASHTPEVKMVRQPLKKLKHMNFHTILSLGQYKELEKEIETSCQERNTINLDNVRNKLKIMKHDHDLANKDLVEYATFANLKIKLKAEFDKDIAKANVLEATLKTWFSNNGCEDSRAKKEELLNVLEEIDNYIKVVEMLLCRIEMEWKRLEEMEDEEESLITKKVEAEQKLDQVEKEWIVIKNLFEDDVAC